MTESGSSVPEPSFAQLLRRYREEAGLSQNALARTAGMSPTSLNRLERERQGLPRQTTVIRLIRALGWSLTDERAAALLAAAGYRSREDLALGAVLESPLRIQVRRGREARLVLRPTLKQLKAALLRAVEHVAELEEIVDELEEDER